LDLKVQCASAGIFEAMGNSASTAFASCHKIVHNEYETTELHNHHHGYGEVHVEGSAVAPMVEESPKLGLRIFSNPCGESDGGALCARFLQTGTEIIVDELEKVKGWDCLRARYERSAKERAGVLYAHPTASQTQGPPKMQWPEGYRFSTTRRFWRAKVHCQDRSGAFQEHLCMLVVASNPEDRTHANIEIDLKDSADVASYASRFNKQLRTTFGDNGGAIPGVMVCGSVGCEVIKSSSSKFASPGEAITIIPYPFPEVKKFLFDGSEDFLEVPQAFFHHAAWLSNSHEFICDLQGVEDDENSIVLVDPCVVRAAKPTVGNLLSALATTVAKTEKENVPQEVSADISSDRFDALHPRCSQLCKVFDPHRRSCVKRHCGLNLSCGV
jgi:hypothetical protein